MFPRWMWASAVKTGRPVLFSQTLEPLFILLRNVSARGWMRSDHVRSCHLSGSRGTRWSQPTCLHDWSGLYYTQVWLRSRQCLPLALGQGTPTAFIPTLCADRSPWDFYSQIFFVTSEVLWFNPTGSPVPCNHWLSPPILVHPKQSTVLPRRENLYPSRNQTKREDKYWWFLETCYFVELKMRFHYHGVSKGLSDLSALKLKVTWWPHHHICDWQFEKRLNIFQLYIWEVEVKLCSRMRKGKKISRKQK